MHSTYAALCLAALANTIGMVNGLGINCRGSSLCHLASWENKAPAPIMQVLRDAVWESKKDNKTAYSSGQHIICVAEKQPITLTGTGTYNTPESEGGSGSLAGSFSLSGGLATGGICLFPQMPSGNITLGTIRPLMDKLLEHGCGTCGSIPIHFVDQGSNDPGAGILTFNYVKSPYCTGGCISSIGTSTNSSVVPATTPTITPRTVVRSAKFAALKE